MYPALWDPISCSPRGFAVWISPHKKTGVGCHAFLQGIFLTQCLSPYLLCLLLWQVGFFFFFFYYYCPLGSPSLQALFLFKIIMKSKNGIFNLWAIPFAFLKVSCLGILKTILFITALSVFNMWWQLVNWQECRKPFSLLSWHYNLMNPVFQWQSFLCFSTSIFYFKFSLWDALW